MCPSTSIGQMNEPSVSAEKLLLELESTSLDRLRGSDEVLTPRGAGQDPWRIFYGLSRSVAHLVPELLLGPCRAASINLLVASRPMPKLDPLQAERHDPELTLQSHDEFIKTVNGRSLFKLEPWPYPGHELEEDNLKAGLNPFFAQTSSVWPPDPAPCAQPSRARSSWCQ